MANLRTVGITNGQGSSGTGTVSAIDATFGAAASASFTCGTTAYAINDVVGASGSNGALTFSNLCPNGAGEYTIDSASLEIDNNGLITNEGGYRLYLYSVTPPSAITDSSAWTLLSGDRPAYAGMGYIDFPTPANIGGTVYVKVNNLGERITSAGLNVFGYLVSLAAYTPSARVFTITLHATPA